VVHSAYVTEQNIDERTAAWLATLAGARGRAALPDDCRAGLVVLDVQQAFCGADSPMRLPAWDACGSRCLELVDRFLAARRPVAFTQHVHRWETERSTLAHFFERRIMHGQPAGRLALEVHRYASRAALLEKDRLSAWSNPRLIRALPGCDTVVLTGVQTQLCVLSTALGAADFDLVPIVVADACAAPNETLHLAALTVLAAGHAHVMSTAEVAAAFFSGAGQ
jgi:nicotinamidase-related amidase